MGGKLFRGLVISSSGGGERRELGENLSLMYRHNFNLASLKFLVHLRILPPPQLSVFPFFTELILLCPLWCYL